MKGHSQTANTPQVTPWKHLEQWTNTTRTLATTGRRERRGDTCSNSATRCCEATRRASERGERGHRKTTSPAQHTRLRLRLPRRQRRHFQDTKATLAAATKARWNSPTAPRTRLGQPRWGSAPPSPPSAMTVSVTWTLTSVPRPGRKSITGTIWFRHHPVWVVTTGLKATTARPTFSSSEDSCDQRRDANKQHLHRRKEEDYEITITITIRVHTEMGDIRIQKVVEGE